MTSSALRLILFLALAAFCLASDSDGYHYLIDYPGKASMEVETSNTPRFGLKPAEAAAFHANLQRLRDLVLAQKVFHPILGIEARGYIRADHGGDVVKTDPVPGYGFLKYYPYVLSSETKKPVRLIATEWEIVIRFNNPTAGLARYGAFFHEPTPAGQIDGFPVYRTSQEHEFIILSSTGKPAWIPVTREEYVQQCIREIEKEMADQAKEISKARLTLDKEQLALLSPKDRAEIEKFLADDRALEIHRQRLKHHQEVLARMPPQERSAQAQYGDPGSGDYLGPQLAPLGGKGIGPAYVKATPNWFDSSRPRTDLQLIVMEFDYVGMDADHPGIRFGNVRGLRLWETLHNLDWKVISGALPK